MKTVAIEDLMISVILSFCENAAELGCPRNKDVDMWFRELSYEDAVNVVNKIIEIQERDELIRRGELCPGCGKKIYPDSFYNESTTWRSNDMNNVDDKEDLKEKDVLMKEIELELENDVVEGIVEFARSKIVNDKKALINYGVNKMLEKVVETKGSCLQSENIL